MKKKILSFLLVLVLLFTLSACSESGNNEASGGGENIMMEFLTCNFNGNKLAFGYKVSGDIKNEEKITVKAINQSGKVENFSFTVKPIEEKQIASIELGSTTGEITLEFSAKSAANPEKNATLVFNSKRPQLTPDSVKIVASALNNGEKAGLIIGYFGAPEDKVVRGAMGLLHAVERFGVPAFIMSDGPAGVRLFPKFTTFYPSSTAVASTWDVDMAEYVGTAIGNEAKVMGVDVQLGPGMTLQRSVLGGRNSEYFSEDPLLSGLMGAAYIKGVQSTGTYACVKHFAANNQETDRTNVSSNISERVLREIYLKNFAYAIIKGNPKMLMTSYNKINGIYTSNFADLLKVVRDEYGFDGTITTDWSTNADVLNKLKGEYPIVADVLDYRQISKLKSTYADGLAAFISSDGRIHGTFNQTITATGRISSTDPNLQNIPMRTDLGRNIRKVFIPKDDYVFVDADYSQIELRILAHFSKDEKLISSFKENEDIHAITASQVFHVPVWEVDSLMRRNAKAVNFGIVYGISAFGLSEDLNISRKEAAEYMEGYFETYPGVKEFQNESIESAKKTGMTKTLFGRIRPIPELSSSNFMQRSFGERIAMNSPIQGTAADIMKIAMIRVYSKLKEKNMKSSLILQIHDELLIETHKDEIEEVKDILIEEMSNAAKLSVPLLVEASVGNDWYEAK